MLTFVIVLVAIDGVASAASRPTDVCCNLQWGNEKREREKKKYLFSQINGPNFIIIRKGHGLKANELFD